MVLNRMLVAAIAVLAGLPIGAAMAQPAPPSQPKPEMMENCPGLVANRVPRAIPAAFQLAALAGDQVRISYAGHSTFHGRKPGRGEDRHRLQRLREAARRCPTS